MGKRKKKAICLYLPDETLEKLNEYTKEYEVDRNTAILMAIDLLLYPDDGSGNELTGELVGYLEIAGITFNDAVRLIKRCYRDKFEKIGIPVD